VTDRPLRADAQRNREQLLETAADTFAALWMGRFTDFLLNGISLATTDAEQTIRLIGLVLAGLLDAKR
jgi:hypothetical protein